MVRSLDNAGNAETHQIGYLNIDGKAPKATVKALTVPVTKATKGKTLTFKVTIADPIPSCGQASLTVRVTTATGKLLRHATISDAPTNTPLTVGYVVPKTMAKGSYMIAVKATDLAGNKQAKASTATQKVK